MAHDCIFMHMYMYVQRSELLILTYNTCISTVCLMIKSDFIDDETKPSLSLSL